MQAIEFQTVAEQHNIRVPEEVPDGVPIRVVLLWDQQTCADEDLKALFASTTEGLTDEDLARPVDFGRPDASWDS